MRNIFIEAAFVFFASCQSKQQQPEVKTAPALEEAAQQNANTQTQITLATDKDLVCGMNVTAGECDTTLHDGKIYGFCSADCKVEFKANPAKYIKS